MMNGYFIGEYYVSGGSKPMETKVKKPIEWMVLEQHADGKTLLFSRNVLDWEIYGCDKLLTWENSYMKKYLSELYKTMFSPEEKDAIIPGDLGPIFLLSEAEIQKYLPSKESRLPCSISLKLEKTGK